MIRKWTLSITLLIAWIVSHSIWLKKVQSWLSPSYGEMLQALTPLPPPLHWVYHPVLWLPLCLVVSVILVSVLAFLLRKTGLQPNEVLVLSVLGFGLSLLLAIPNSHYIPAKRAVVGIAMVLFAYSLIVRPTEIKNVVRRLDDPKQARLLAIVLIFVSIAQRFIAMYMQPQVLVEGDDPHIYHSYAQLILNGGWPHPFFSPGMPFFLATVYGIFGVHDWIPAAIMISGSGPALYWLYRTVSMYYGGPLVGVFVVLLFNLNSQYVAMSNHFWNENVFILLLPFALYSFHRSLDPGVDLRSRFLHAIVLGFFLGLMTLFRSWTPALVAALTAMIIFSYRSVSVAESLRRIAFLAVSVLFMAAITGGYIYLRSEYSGYRGYISSNALDIFVQGNNPYSQGSFTRHFYTFARDLGLSVESKEFQQAVVRYNVDHPLHFLTMVAKKMLMWFWGAPHPKYMGGYYIMPMSLLAYYVRILFFFLAAYGFVRLLREKRPLPVLIYAVLTLVFSVLMVEHRFALIGFVPQSIAVARVLASHVSRGEQ